MIIHQLWRELLLNCLIAVMVFCIIGFAPIYWQSIAFLTLVYASVAVAWNIAGGIAGTFSFGHGLFFGLGAYSSTILFTRYGISPWIGLAVGAILASAAGIAVAWLAERCRIGDLAFAVMTLAVAESGLILVENLDYLGASRGISIPPGSSWTAMQYGSNVAYLILGGGLLIGCQIIATMLFYSGPGFRFRAVRENPLAAQAMGIDTFRERAAALGVSGGLTAIAGTLYAQNLLFVDPVTFFGPSLTIAVILFTLVGGMGTIWGPVIGTLVLFPLGEILRGGLGGSIPGADQLLYGTLVVACVLVFPGGILGSLLALIARRSK